MTTRPMKVVWHPLSLQALSPTKLIGVIDKVLDGEYALLTGRLQDLSVNRGAPSEQPDTFDSES